MSDANQDIIPLLNNELTLDLPLQLSTAQLKEQITNHINHLINTDFEKLIFYLYRIDVHEGKMKQLLQQHQGENAAELIAQLIIDRQLQKLESKQNFHPSPGESDEERW